MRATRRTARCSLDHPFFFRETSTMSRSFRAIAAASAVMSFTSIAACGGAKSAATGETAAASAAPAASDAPAAPAAGPQTPDAGRQVITVQLIADEKGSRFEPSEVKAHHGDVIRFILSQGVHNVDFLPDSNAGAHGLPAASDMLQLSGQTVDVKVTFPKGTYYFQCDPHAALGMHGHLEVED